MVPRLQDDAWTMRLRAMLSEPHFLHLSNSVRINVDVNEANYRRTYLSHYFCPFPDTEDIKSRILLCRRPARIV